MESKMEIIMAFNRSGVGGLFSVMCYNTPRLADCLLRLACFFEKKLDFVVAPRGITAIDLLAPFRLTPPITPSPQERGGSSCIEPLRRIVI
jgi:hypothetical protein